MVAGPFVQTNLICQNKINAYHLQRKIYIAIPMHTIFDAKFTYLFQAEPILQVSYCQTQYYQTPPEAGKWEMLDAVCSALSHQQPVLKMNYHWHCSPWSLVSFSFSCSLVQE